MKNSAPAGPPADSELIPTRASLLARLKDWDDSRSWQEFFDTYWRLVYGRARKAELSDQEAQEVVQESVIAVARRMHEFKYDPAVASFKTWLYQIVSRRIAELEDMLRRAVPIDETGAHKSGFVVVGSGVQVEQDGKMLHYQIVGAPEADPRQGKISNESPVGRALLGHGKNDTVSVHAPAGVLKVKILKID